MRRLNKQFANLKSEYGEYEDYYRDQQLKYTGSGADQDAINVHIQLNYKGDKLVELREITQASKEKVNALHERLLENREKLQEVNEAKNDMDTGIVQADREVTFLTRREAMKRYMLAGLIALLGLLDFIALIYRITRLFR